MVVDYSLLLLTTMIFKTITQYNDLTEREQCLIFTITRIDNSFVLRVMIINYGLVGGEEGGDWGGDGGGDGGIYAPN